MGQQGLAGFRAPSQRISGIISALGGFAEPRNAWTERLSAPGVVCLCQRHRRRTLRAKRRTARCAQMLYDLTNNDSDVEVDGECDSDQDDEDDD